MANYRVTLFFNQSIMGWSETYISKDASSTNALQLIQRLVNTRNTLLFEQQYWVGIRVSDYAVRRKSRVFLPGQNLWDESNVITIPIHGPIVNTADEATQPDQLRATLQWQAVIADGRKALRYLSGIPDRMSATEPATVKLAGLGGWWQSWVDFTTRLIGDGWMIRARTTEGTDPYFQVNDLVVASPAPDRLGVVTGAAAGGGINVGDKVALSGFRPQRCSKSSLNGTYIVASKVVDTPNDRATFYLRCTEGTSPVGVCTLGRIRRVAYGLFTIQSTPILRIGIHKRGRPSMAPRGRRIARCIVCH